jgi:hypothetical protein
MEKLLCGWVAGLPDFSWNTTPKREEIYQIYQMSIKYTKWQPNTPNDYEICIPNGNQINQMAIKYAKWP